MDNVFAMTKHKKSQLIHMIINNKNINKIKNFIKGNDWHKIKINKNVRQSLINNIFIDGSDSNLILLRSLIIHNNTLKKYIIDNNIKYNSLDGVIFNIDSYNYTYDNIDISGKHGLSVCAIINDINDKIFICVSYNVRSVFIRYMQSRETLMKLHKLNNEINNLGINHFFIIELRKYSYDTNNQKKHIENHYVNLFDSKINGLNIIKLSNFVLSDFI